MSDTQHQPTEAELATMSPDQLDAYAAAFQWDEGTDDQDGTKIETRSALHPERRSHVLTIRFNATELDRLNKRAQQAGMSVSAYVRAAVLDSTAVPELLAVRVQLEAATSQLQRLTS